MPLHPPLHALRARAHPPLSSANLSRRRPPQCPFHTFPPLRADDANDRRTHYEVLDIPPNAPPKVIKKKFYALSLRHHPDRNPSDRDGASARFARVSAAYNTLANPSARATYDRDLARTNPSAAPSSSPTHPHGSHSSAQTPFGARPASGLSRRRGAFRGPPPSFYRAGGYGRGAAAGRREAEAKAQRARAQAGGDKATGSEAGKESGDAASPGGPAGGGFSPGQGEAWQGREVPHFDREGHFRRLKAQEERLNHRRRVLEERERRMREVEGEIGGGRFGSVGVIVGVLAVGILVPSMFGVPGG